MIALPVACLTHWYAYLLYAAPALVVFGATLHSFIVQKREQKAAALGSASGPRATP